MIVAFGYFSFCMRDEEILEILFQILSTRMRNDGHCTARLSEKIVRHVIHAAIDFFTTEPTVLQLAGPIYVVGDIHGNIDFLIRLFQTLKYPPDETYLFLGDYVDRGRYSIEVLLFLYALKVRFKKYLI